MTIDSKITVRAENVRNGIFNQPPNIVSTVSKCSYSGYDERLFLCPKFDKNAAFEISPNRILIDKIKENWCLRSWQIPQARLYKKLRKCLAFKGKIHYNNVLYVVGLWLMQGVAKLRKVAEVFISDFNYLKLPHIANSKRTIVAK